MHLLRKDEDTFLVVDKKELSAVIRLDFLHQVELVILRTKDEAKRRQIKELALSHAIQYCVERSAPLFGGVLMATHRSRSPRSKAEAYGLMDFRLIPDSVKTLDDEALNAALFKCAKIVEAEYGTCKRTLLAAVSHVIQKYGLPLKFVMMPGRFPNEVSVHFLSTSLGKEFRFWSWLPLEKASKHPDHPQIQGLKSVVAVNASTEAVINDRGSGVKYLIFPGAPGEASSVFRKRSTEEFVEAPSFSVVIDKWRFVSKDSYRFVVDLLTAALGLRPEYVEII
jgi:hypothetical protein